MTVFLDTWKYMIPCVLVCYVVGSISPSHVVARIAKKDITKEGSGNAGTTNVLRCIGPLQAVLVFVIDAGKAYLSVFVSTLVVMNLTNYENLALICGYAAGVGVIVGHCFSCFHRGKGGKGVACTIGIAFAVSWKLGVVCVIVMLLVILLSKMVSLASVVMVLIFFGLVCYFGDIFFPYSLVITALVICKHIPNIIRIFKGEENKIGHSSKKTR